ncbi:MAG: hypothetical protein J0I21_03125 [Alphaproteobacteria bacterium]|nr:hypothetical protein [Alphaproteobacteria bacterium]
MRRPILCLALAVLAGACTPPSQPKPVPVAEARARLIGLPLAHIQSCMGRPPIAMARGSIALWSYPSAVWDPPPQIVTDPAYATFDVTPFAGDPDPDGIAMNAPLPQSRCVVNFVFDRGILRAITYKSSGGKLLSDRRECTQLIHSCVE